MSHETKDAILKCLKSLLEPEIYVKLQRVLKSVNKDVTESLLRYYKHNLELSLSSELPMQSFPRGYDFRQHVCNKTQFYSFRYVFEIGRYLVDSFGRSDGCEKSKVEKNLVTLLKILVHQGLISKYDTGNFALVELEQLCTCWNITLPGLYQLYRYKLLKVIIKVILRKLEKHNDRDCSLNGYGANGAQNGTTNGANGNVNGKGDHPKINCVIMYVTRAFELFSISKIGSQDEAESMIILTYLITKDKYHEPIALFLRHLAMYHGIDVACLLRSHIQTIMVSLLLRGKMSTFEMTESLKRLCAIAGKDSPRDLLMYKFSSIRGTLILHYSIDQKKIRSAIEYLSTWEPNELDQAFEGQFEDEKQFIDYLSPTMAGILLGVDSYLNQNRKVIDSPDGVRFIESLSAILSKLEGKQVENIHHKLLSTFGLILRLRQDRNNQDLNRAIIDLWHTFLKQIGSELKQQLTLNICVALYDLIEDCPERVAKLYSELLLGRQSRTNNHQRQSLFFIPNAPGFEKIYEFITPHVHRENMKYNLQDLEDAINGTIPLMKVENQKCHVLAVTRIRDLLKANQGLLTVSMLTNPEKPLNSTISRTIESLLAILSTPACSTLIAESLGVIGALNPARVNYLIYGCFEDASFIDIQSDSFLVNLIETLKNSLLSDRTSESEKASYALQVIIETYNIHKKTNLFSLLSDQAQKACELCKNCYYMGSQRVPPDMSIPLYTRFKNEGQYFYLDWLDKFFLVLIPYLRSINIKEVLHACTYNFKHNLKLAEYLLPVVATNLILNQETSLKLIESELMAIINDDVGMSSQDLETVHSPDFEQNMQTLHYQCANIVFRIMDALARIKKGHQEFLAKKQSLKRVGRTYEDRDAELREEQWARLNRFMDCMPKDKLAMLASKCRAHARALYYFDQYYFDSMNWKQRDVTKNVNFDKYWTPLQKVFIALDDSYEAAGIQMRRTSPTTTTDDIANLESAGKFDKAILHYESLLDASDPQLDKKLLLEDALRCLSNQGDDQRLYERSKHLIERYPHHKSYILPAAIEAFHKLGKWDELGRALNTDACRTISDSTSVCQGQLLDSLMDPTKNASDQLKMVRKISVKPLSIAMIDRSAYYRGYQNLLFLHSIEDYSLALDILECKQFQTQKLDENTTDGARVDLLTHLRSLFKTWYVRNKLVQPSIRSLEPLLAWQRSISSVLMRKYPFVQPELSLDVGSMWLESAKIAREARCFDRSFYCVAQAQKWFGSDLIKNNLYLQVECTLAQAKIDWDRGDSIEAIRSLKASVQRLQGHGLYKHLEQLRNQDEDGRRKENNPYQHPDDESHLEISNINDVSACQDCCSFGQTHRESFAKLKLLLTKYTEEAAATTPRSLITMYGECVHLGVNQEEVFLLLARYYDKLANYYTENPQALRVSDKDLESTNENGSSVVRSDRVTKTTRRQSSSQDKKDKELAHKEEVISKLMQQSIYAFGHSLKYGVRYLEESMPRMLNIWYDLGSKKCLESMPFYPRAISHRIDGTIRLIDTLILKSNANSLPSYYCMAALSLLLSRVCHPNAQVSEKTINIVTQLLEDYPHQMMWRLAAMLADQVQERKRAADSILKAASKKNQDVAKIIKDYITFINLMRKVTKNHSYGEKSHDKSAKSKLLKAGGCHIRDIEPMCEKLDIAGKVIAPTQSSINPILPTANDCDSLRRYKIYPDRYMSFIYRFGSEVHVYNSLQKPRKVNFIVEDGKTISIIAKAGDDLRKDSRCTEFFNLLNRILRRGGQSNMRYFEIATFLVLPLESFAGLIEMVPNCETYRSVIESLYKEILGDSWNTTDFVKKQNARGQYSDADMYQHFVERVLPKMKFPVFQRFFQRRFTDPTTWYMARLAYTRSTALISIAGYIIGLGDRHLDNVLIDMSQGRAVHVDFNLLFHQAETLPVPEIVPFRLTRNLVAGLGPMGTEGSFRRYCEIAMRSMRSEKELLLTTLKPFLHDPCCEWTKEREQNRKTSVNDPGRDGNRTARDRIDVVEKKLRGFPKPGGQAKPLTVLNAFSVEAQVDILIEEATNLWNLSQMYYGWCPHV